MSRRKNGVGADAKPALPAPLDVASMFVGHSHEKILDQTSVMPLQAPKNALFASGAAMAVAAWRWRVVDKRVRNHRVQVEA